MCPSRNLPALEPSSLTSSSSGVSPTGLVTNATAKFSPRNPTAYADNFDPPYTDSEISKAEDERDGSADVVGVVYAFMRM